LNSLPNSQKIEYRGWKVHVFRMACSPAYPTPWCGWAKQEKDSKIVGFNKEGRTPEDALAKTKAEVDRRCLAG